MLELAIFGSVMLAALSFLIRMGMTWNYEQEIRMAAFRRALAAAYADNARPDDKPFAGTQDAVAATFHAIADRQMPNPSDGFMSLPRVRTQASAFAEWGNRLTFATADGRKTQQQIVVRANDQERQFRQEDFPKDLTRQMGDGVETVEANRAIVRESVISNKTGALVGGAPAVITQTKTGTTLESKTKTSARTVVNTKEKAGQSIEEPIEPAKPTKVSW